jgi:inositol-phosphate phosphatase / L-galactose 1-phosphate phosphatase / histidinol-phosphatase
MIPANDIALAHRLADAAGTAIRPYFRAEFGLETKADSSPVTLADRAAESAIRAILEDERPADGIIGEEYGTVREGAARQWVIDPIDGTTSFVAGRAIFGTLIALMKDGWPVLGMIDQPILGERWVGAVGQPGRVPVPNCPRRSLPRPDRICLASIKLNILWHSRQRLRTGG